jgi:hypothetical protein
MRRTFVVGVVVLFAACGHDSMTAPTAPVSPAFGLVGAVSTTATRPLAQARVEALDGPQKGAVAVTDDAGAFAFNAIFTSRFTLRASKEGYRDQSIVISGGQSNISFTLDSVNNPFDTQGTYEVTFDADVACKDLPSAARSRTYSVSFSQGGATFYRGTLSGADFALGVPGSYPGYDWDVVNVRVLEDVAQISFDDPPIWEHLTPKADLVIYGDAQSPVRADTSHMSFGGSFTYCPAAERESYPECEVPEITCRSQSHQLTLTRK